MQTKTESQFCFCCFSLGAEYLTAMPIIIYGVMELFKVFEFICLILIQSPLFDFIIKSYPICMVRVQSKSGELTGEQGFTFIAVLVLKNIFIQLLTLLQKPHPATIYQ